MTTIPRETLEATLPSGRTIKLKELTGQDELIASKEAGDNQGLSVYSQVMRSIVMLDDKDFDPSRHTPQSTRDEFSAKDWQLVLDAFNRDDLARWYASVALEKGMHRIRVDHVFPGYNELSVWWKPPGAGKRVRIPDGVLFHDPKMAGRTGGGAPQARGYAVAGSDP